MTDRPGFSPIRCPLLGLHTMTATVIDYATGTELPGRCSPLLASESRAEPSGTGAVLARWDGDCWRYVTPGQEAEGEDVRTVYVVDDCPAEPTAEQLQRIEADPDFPRGQYARDVLYGRQALSGADLRGKARTYGAGYARLRARVIACALRHGLRVVYLPPHGRKVLRCAC